MELDGHDVKSLFRRSQALRGLGRLDRAASDLQRCVRLEPKNKAFQEALRDLGSSAQEKVGPGPLPLYREASVMGRCHAEQALLASLR